jgi:hypothetical protein
VRHTGLLRKESYLPILFTRLSVKQVDILVL